MTFSNSPRVSSATPPLRADSREPGYFGWTDRYGIRAPLFRSGPERRAAARPPFFIAND